jgi:hypothetical protein
MGQSESAVPPLALFFRLSVGRKWIVGMEQTSCMGSASTKQEFFQSQPAPSSYSHHPPPPDHLLFKAQADLTPTLGGYTRLLSSTVETINSQERLSTEI